MIIFLRNYIQRLAGPGPWLPLQRRYTARTRPYTSLCPNSERLSSQNKEVIMAHPSHCGCGWYGVGWAFSAAVTIAPSPIAIQCCHNVGLLSHLVLVCGHLVLPHLPLMRRLVGPGPQLILGLHLLLGYSLFAAGNRPRSTATSSSSVDLGTG